MAGLVRPTRAGLYGGSGSSGLYAGGLWTPFALGSSLVAFWDAAALSSLTFNSGNVASWRDLASGIVASQATAANQPGYSASGINGLPVLVFNGSSTGLLSTAFNVPSLWSATIVGKQTAQSGVNSIFDADGVISNRTGQLLRTVNGTDLSSIDFTSSGNYSFQYGGKVTGAAQILNSEVSTGSMVGYVDGTAGAVTTTSGTPIGGSRVVSIGCFANMSSAYFNGQIGSALIVNGPPTTTNRQKLEGYLAAKWGTRASLPAGHQYKASAPTMSAEDVERLCDEGMYARDAAYRQQLGLAPLRHLRGWVQGYANDNYHRRASGLIVPGRLAA